MAADLFAGRVALTSRRMTRAKPSPSAERASDRATLIVPSLLLAALLALAVLVLFMPANMVLAKDGDWPEQQFAGQGLPAALEDAGWRLLAVPDKAEARFALDHSDGIRVSADSAVGFLYKPVATGMGEKRKLGWRWRVDRAVPATDLTQVGRDDRSLAIHLVFPADPERLSFWQRLDLAITGAVAAPLAGSVLTYVWGGSHAPGSMMRNPYFDARGRIIVLRSSDEATGRWFSEEIDFIADFERAFGYTPGQPLFVAISADSDDTGSLSLGQVAGLRFSG